MNGEVRIVEDVPSAFAEVVADAFANRASSKQFSIAFSGGSTARPCYENLAKQNIEWSEVTAIWGDERCVPLDDDDSNYKLTKEALLDRVPDLAAVYPMYSEGATKYEDIIRDLLPLDVVHLGMGDDGHTASLFPGSPALESPADALVVETGDEYHPHPRITLTFGAIAQSRLVVFTVMGAAKREMFARIQDGEHFPAGQVAAHQVLWLVDAAAAG